MIPHTWRFSLSLSRAAVALTFLVIYYLSIRSLLQIPGLAFLWYFLCSVIAVWWRPTPAYWVAIAMLAGDALMSLFWVAIYSGAIGNPELWFRVSAASWIFVLSSAALTQQPWLVGALTLFALLTLSMIPTANSTNLTALVVCGGVIAIVSSLQKQNYEGRLQQLSRQNVLLRVDVQKSREHERQRIAADFHDGPLQAFIGFLMRLELLRKLMERDVNRAMDELKQLQVIAKQQVNDGFYRGMRIFPAVPCREFECRGQCFEKRVAGRVVQLEYATKQCRGLRLLFPCWPERVPAIQQNRFEGLRRCTGALENSVRRA